MAAADADDAGAADADDAGAADAHDAGGRPRGFVGHGGFHGGLWQRLMLMLLEAVGACGPGRQGGPDACALASIRPKRPGTMHRVPIRFKDCHLHSARIVAKPCLDSQLPILGVGLLKLRYCNLELSSSRLMVLEKYLRMIRAGPASSLLASTACRFRGLVP